MKNVWSGNEDRLRLKEFYRFPGIIIRNIKYSWQRITKGYCDRDLWSIDGWFMEIMPQMLQQLKETRYGSPGVLGTQYIDESGSYRNDTCHEEWDKILDEMIFLFQEMDEDTCQKRNPYEQAHEDVYNEFQEKYGCFGEKLNPKNATRQIYFPYEIAEYSEIEDKYYEAEKELAKYREKCKDKAFNLFAKWFYYLWD